MRPWTR